MTGPIHIALTFDDRFWAPAYATMRSVCLLTHRRKDLVFHLCHFGLLPEHAQTLATIASEFGAQIRSYDLTTLHGIDARLARLPAITAARWHKVIYARLFLPELLPADVERVLYLDTDLLVRIDIARLYDLDLGQNIAAAALDPMRTGFQTVRDFKPKPHFDPADPYFNSGVLLLDLKKFGAMDFMQALARKVGPDNIADLFYDQDILNIVLADKWHVLSHRWNHQSPQPGVQWTDPFIVHFTGKHKPWNIFAKVAYKRIYRHTMTNDVFWRYWRERMRARFLPFGKAKQ